MAPRSSSSASRPSKHRSTLSLQKTEITIHVYDLLPPSRLSSVLWSVGASLLHSGVVINGKEYAYGGHDKRGVSGVYWTKPGAEPPGGSFRSEILHGFTLATEAEIDGAIREVSEEFLGTAYNLLTRNCNHFTAHLCKKLTGTASPGWLNRAAAIGVALPCIVPREWIEPPDYSVAEGALLGEDGDEDEDDDSDANETSGMLGSSRPQLLSQELQEGWEDSERAGGKGKGKRAGKTAMRDSAGRQLPVSEVATR